MSEKNQTIMMITFWCITNIVMWGRFVYLLIVKRRKEAKEFLLACLAMLTPFGGVVIPLLMLVGILWVFAVFIPNLIHKED